MISSFDPKSFRRPYQSRHHLTLLYLFKEHDISTISGSPHCKGIPWIDRTRKAKCLTASTPVFREGSPGVRPPAGETAEERRHQRASTRSVSYESPCKLSVPTRMSERRNNRSSLCASGGQFLSPAHGKS
ncbi:hypothetical protein KIN20_033736 [Parelaphostrongylus tenuis]|uniref:Uncharacterized protein n=1 Tax=Parelaphostrongylus tenuis TaxID=148309 RepID=A0AAD5WJG9_PARTN|nr:hypothetical protein KIN20_033736 [Parelaphostrongylus tenuis]